MARLLSYKNLDPLKNDESLNKIKSVKSSVVAATDMDTECYGCKFEHKQELPNPDHPTEVKIAENEENLEIQSGKRKESFLDAVDTEMLEDEEGSLETRGSVNDCEDMDDLDVVALRGDNKRSQSMENLLSVIQNDSTKQGEIVKEILNHESRHLDLLTNINKYKHILQESKVPEDVLWQIFRNIDELIEAQKSLVASLENMILEWESRRHSFTDLMDLYVFLHLKVKEYAKNINNGVKELRNLFEKNHKFKEALHDVTYEGHKLSLETLLSSPTKWLCNSLEMIKHLLETAKADGDKQILEQTLSKLKDREMLMGNGKNNLEQTEYIRSDLFVEPLPNDQKKLRHVFLFTTMLVCAKQKLQPSSANQDDQKVLWDVKAVDKFEVKWFIPLQDLVIHPHKVIDNNEKRRSEITALKDRIRDLKIQLISEKNKLQCDLEVATGKALKRSASNNFSLRKMMIKKEMEKICHQIFKAQTELLLLSPNFVFVLSNGKERPHQLLVSSLRDIETWKWHLVKAQKSITMLDSAQLSGAAISAVLDKYRRNIDVVKVASWPMTHDDGVSGILTVHITSMAGANPDYKYYLALEVDSFKLPELKARTKTLSNSTSLVWNESFDIELDCSLVMVIHIYQTKTFTEVKDSLVGFFEIQLKPEILRKQDQEFKTPMLGNDNVEFTLRVDFSLVSKRDVLKREPSIKKTGLFGIPLRSIVARENASIAVQCPVKNVPMMLVHCMQRVEEEGIDEEGIYRISGSKTEINELYKRFNKNVQNSINALSNYDLHAITGLVKTYLRELPEPLMLNINYRTLLEIARYPEESRRIEGYITIISSLPEPNQSTFLFVLEHFKRVCEHSDKNQMVSGNLGLILGTTLMLPPPQTASSLQDAAKSGMASLAGMPDIAQETVNSIALAQVFTQIMNGFKDGRIQIRATDSTPVAERNTH